MSLRNIIIAIFFYGLLLSIWPVSLFAQCVPPTSLTDVVFVKPIATGTGDGSSWDNALDGKYLASYLRSNAVDGTKIYLAAGTYIPYMEDCDAALAQRQYSFEFKYNLRLRGGFSPTSTGTDTINTYNPQLFITRLSGEIQNDATATNNSYHVVTAAVAGKNIFIDGVYISDGYAIASTINTTNGAAIYHTAESLNLTNVVIERNTADRGGGIYALGKVALTGVKIINNAATGSDGGAIFSNASAPILLVNSELSTNSAKNNGGSICANASLTLANVSITASKAGANGGGVYAYDSLILKGSVYFASDTTGKRGGGIYKSNLNPFDASGLDTLTILNCAANGVSVDNSGKGDCDGGGGIYTQASLDLYSVKHVLVQGCYAVKEGGGIYVSNTSSPIVLKLANATIIGCEAGHDGGGIENYGTQKCTMFVKNSTFFNNRSARYGGGIGAGASLVLEGKVILDRNIAGTNGGGISHWDSTLNVAHLDTLIMTNNEVTASGSKGGGIWTVAPFDLSAAHYVDISNNSAKGSGGGIYCYWNDNASSSAVVKRSPLTLKNVTFSGNSAVTGGAVYVGDTLRLQENVRFNGNIASTNGGAIYANSHISAEADSLIFTGNTANTSGGALYSTGTAVSITFSRAAFTLNTAGSSGGALYVGGTGSLTVSACRFADNFTTSTAAGGGGAVYYTNTGMNASFSDCDFTNNSTGRDGGAISASLSGSIVNRLNINNSRFANNSAGINGGAVYFFNTKTVATIAGSTLGGNVAGNSGGGVYGSGPLVLSGTTVSNNKAGYKAGVYAGIYYGGGVYANDTLQLIGTVTFAGDTASHSGGAIYKTYSNSRPFIVTALDTLTIIDNAARGGAGGGFYTAAPLDLSATKQVNISRNFAAQNGGGIYANLALKLKNAVVSDNTAGWIFATGQYSTSAYHGGGMYANDTLVLQGSLIINGNIASGTGGGIYKTYTNSRPFVAAALDTLTVTGNTARNGTGGGIHTAAPLDLSVVKRVSISGNTSSQSGGGIYANLALTLKNAAVSDNKAGWSSASKQYTGTYYGGGVYANNALELQGYIILDRDTTSNSGAGIYKHSIGNFTVTELDSLVATGCTALAGAGGALYTGVVLDLSSLKRAQIVSNTAGTDGGGIYATNQLLLTNALLRANAARNNGGAIYKSATGELYVGKSTIAGNSAKLGGGLYTAVAAVANRNTLVNSTFSQNIATAGGGGAIHASSTGALGAVTVALSTFNGNTATLGGNAIHFANAGGKALYGNIIYGNGETGLEIQNAPVAANCSYNIVRNATLAGVGNMNLASGMAEDVFGNVIGNLAVLANNGGQTPTLAIRERGYAHNRIPSDLVNTWALGLVDVDQRDSLRSISCGVDIGAVELQVKDTASYELRDVAVCVGSWLSADTLVVATLNIRDTLFFTDATYSQPLELPLVVTNSQRIFVKFISTSNCEMLDSLDITAYDRPVPTISGEGSVCAATSEAYSTEAGMSGYTWTVAGGTITGDDSTSSITVAWGSAGSGSVAVSYTNSSGCVPATPTEEAITINARPVPTISGSASVCAATSETYSTESGMSGYTWTVAGGTITGDDSTSSITVAWGAAGSGSVAVSNTNSSGCVPAIPTEEAITINARPVPTISGSASVCAATSEAYSTEAGMSGYTWTVAGGTIASGDGTNSITVAWGSAGSGSVAVSYTNSSGCVPEAPTIQSITINLLPTFAINSVATDEGDDLVFTVTLMGGHCSVNAATVQYATVDGSAEASADYTDTSGTLAFIFGETSKTITIATAADDVLEGAENLYLRLSNPVNATFTGGDETLDGIGTINDQTNGEIIIEKYRPLPVDVSASEPSTNGSFYIRFANPVITCTTPVKVGVAVSAESTAESGVDYDPIDVTYVTIPAGQNGVELPIMVKNNQIVQGTRLLVLTITSIVP